MGIVPLVAGHLQALYIEEIFTFFLACVKTVYDRLTPAHSRFLELFSYFCAGQVSRECHKSIEFQ